MVYPLTMAPCHGAVNDVDATGIPGLIDRASGADASHLMGNLSITHPILSVDVRYSPERKEAILQKMVLPKNLTIPELAEQEGAVFHAFPLGG